MRELEPDGTVTIGRTPDNDIAGPLAGRDDFGAGRPIRIGRDPTSSIAVDDLMVSRHHAEVHTLPGGGRELRDIGSHNGTYVNGVRVEKTIVAENDLISIGSHLCRVTASKLDDPNVQAIGLAIVSDKLPESGVVIDGYIDRESDPRFRPTDENFWSGVSGLGAIAGAALLVARLALSPRRRGR